jgi:hypothetical protein
MAKRKRQTRQWPKEKDRQDNGIFWPLSCLSLSFGHCLVCLFLLAIVLSVFIFWPLSCLSLSFGHCLVCLYLLAIVLSDGQKIKTDKTMTKR